MSPTVATSKPWTRRTALYKSLHSGEFVLEYQPVFRLASGCVSAYEALVRHREPDGSLLPPDLFIPPLEGNGNIDVLGQWVLQEACLQRHRWRAAGLCTGTVAVNVSALQLQQPGFEQMVFDVLDHTGLPPELLDLELTERLPLADGCAARRQVEALRQTGIGFHLDDFGTGCNDLRCLRELPVDKIKLPQRFVERLDDPAVEATLPTLVRLAHSQGASLVAEGISTQVQLEILQRHGCDEGQGYFLSPPLRPRSVRKRRPPA